jgi:PIN domain
MLPGCFNAYRWCEDEMAQKLLLVDFENVQQVELTRLDEQFRVAIFIGSEQKRVPIELVASAQKLGNRVEWLQVEGNGSNALDFHIACYLGRVMERDPSLHCFVLSRDKGFDPLLKHLKKHGLKCKRIGSQLEIDPKPVANEEQKYKRAFELLGKLDKKVRPRKRSTLSQHISSMFQKKILQAEVDKIIDTLIANAKISESNNTISYNF